MPRRPYFAVQRHARGRRRRQAAGKGQHVRRHVTQLQGAGVGRREGVGDGRAIPQQLQVVALRRRGQRRRGQGAREFDGARGVGQDHAGVRRHRARKGRAARVGHRQRLDTGARADRAAGRNRSARARVQRQALRVGQRPIHRAAQGDARPGL